MDHERLLARAVFRNVLEPETLGKIEIELNGRELPESSNRLHQLDINFRSVKGGFAGNGLVGNLQVVQNFVERTAGEVPHFVAADKALFVIWVPGAQFHLVVGKTKRLEDGQRKFNAADDLIFNLLRRAEDVRIILGKAAHAQQTVHDARAFIAVYRPQFAQAHGKIAV